jgi:hypothetical protein
MKGSVRASVLVLVVMVGFPALVRAQEFRHIELNPFVAFSSFTKSNYQIGFPQSITPLQEQFKFNETLRGGVRFNVNTTRHWGEEFFFSYEPNKAHFIRQTPPTATQTYDVHIYNFGINAMYYLNEEEGAQTRPFLSVGLGGLVSQPSGLSKQIANDPLRGDLPGFETAAEIAANFGVGVKRHLTDDFDLRMDVRDYVSRNPTFGLPRSSSDPNAVVFPAFGAINNLEVSAGIIFKFKR